MRSTPSWRRSRGWIAALLAATLLTAAAPASPDVARAESEIGEDAGQAGGAPPAPAPMDAAARAPQIQGWPGGYAPAITTGNPTRPVFINVYVPSEEYDDVPWWQLESRWGYDQNWLDPALQKLPVNRGGLQFWHSGGSSLAGWGTTLVWSTCTPLNLVLISQFDQQCGVDLPTTFGTGLVTYPTTMTYRQVRAATPEISAPGWDPEYALLMLNLVPSGPTGLVYFADQQAWRTYYIMWVRGTPPDATPPSVTAHPEDARVGEGEVASFAASATGADFTQWQRSNDGGTTWSDVRGATSATYTTPAATPGDDGALFRARFRNSGGTVYSNSARLSVLSDEPPVVVEHPLSVRAGVGHPVQLSARAQSDSPLSVQWERLDPSGGDWSPVPGGTSDDLRIDRVTKADDGARFRAVFSNAAGSVVTDEAVLSVWQSPDVRLRAAPRVVLVDSLVSP